MEPRDSDEDEYYDGIKSDRLATPNAILGNF